MQLGNVGTSVAETKESKKQLTATSTSRIVHHAKGVKNVNLGSAGLGVVEKRKLRSKLVAYC